jgi:large-conductance mechanosensitive channel
MKRTRKPAHRKTTTQSVTNGSTIRIETPKSNRQPKTSTVVSISQEINPVSGFVGFLREHAIVGLAVGFAIATQLQGIVKDLTANFINPLFTVFVGGTVFSQRTFTVTYHGRHADFGWGQLIYDLINFLFVMLVIYVLIRIFKLDKLDQPKAK